MIRAVALLLVLALAGILVRQWHDWPRPLDPALRPDPATTTVEDTAPATLPPMTDPPEAKETYAAVTERTLFRPQRKPEPPQPTEPEPEPAADTDGTLEGLDLSAVLIAPGKEIAWIKDPSAEQLKPLRLGDDQAGWSVKTILPDRVVFERRGETNELILQDFSGPLPPPPVAAPPPPRPNPPAARPGQPPAPKPTAAQQPKTPPTGTPQHRSGPGAGPRSPTPTPPRMRPNVRKPTPPQPR